MTEKELEKRVVEIVQRTVNKKRWNEGKYKEDWYREKFLIECGFVLELFEFKKSIEVDENGVVTLN